MPLASGTKLGPYEIVTPLGAGGMDEVYRARDTRLERSVAVKILPSHLSENAEARQRFDREARAVSSLNHPNICTLYDVVVGNRFQSEKPQYLFDLDAHPVAGFYAVTRDGQKIYMATYGPGSTAPITVTTNWTELLKK